MKRLNLALIATSFALLTANLFLALYATLQIVAPRLADAAQLFDSMPIVFGAALTCACIAFVFKTLLD